MNTLNSKFEALFQNLLKFFARPRKLLKRHENNALQVLYLKCLF